MNEPTTEMIIKLPKWAQEHIRDLGQQRAAAVRALNEFCDSQTVSQFYTVSRPYTGESSGPKRRYVHTQWMKVAHAGNEYEIGTDNHGRLVLRSNTARLIIKPDCSNTILIEGY